MDLYDRLLMQAGKLPSGTEFMISQIYGDGWKEIPAKEKIRMGRRFLTEVKEGNVPGILFQGMREGRTHSHKWYKKL